MQRVFPADTKILIVDDSSFARVMLRNLLRDLKLEAVIESANVADAQMVLLAPEHVRPPVGLIISDLNMPDASGLEFLGWVRGRPELKGVPFVLLTASQDMTEIKQAGQLSVSHFLLKPLELNVLRDRLAFVWTKHGRAYLTPKPKA